MKRSLLGVEVWSLLQWRTKDNTLQCIVILKNVSISLLSHLFRHLPSSTIRGILQSEIRQVFGVDIKQSATTMRWIFFEDIRQLCKKIVMLDFFVASLDEHVWRYEKEWDNNIWKQRFFKVVRHASLSVGELSRWGKLIWRYQTTQKHSQNNSLTRKYSDKETRQKSE